MTKSVNASTVVTFSTNLSGDIVLEVDDRLQGLNKGNTDFRPGDSPGFLLFKTQNVSIVELLTTQGVIQTVGSDSMVIEEWVSIVREVTTNLKYPASSGSLSITQTYGDGGAGAAAQGTTLTFPTPRLATYKVRYTTSFLMYRVTGSFSGDGAPILIYAGGILT